MFLLSCLIAPFHRRILLSLPMKHRHPIVLRVPLSFPLPSSVTPCSPYEVGRTVLRPICLYPPQVSRWVPHLSLGHCAVSPPARSSPLCCWVRMSSLHRVVVPLLTSWCLPCCISWSSVGSRSWWQPPGRLLPLSNWQRWHKGWSFRLLLSGWQRWLWPGAVSCCFPFIKFASKSKCWNREILNIQHQCAFGCWNRGWMDFGTRESEKN